MLSLTFIVVFIFCAAIAVASILMVHQFIATYNAEFHRNYFYYLIAFFAFAFYAIWGPVIMRVILSSIELESKIVGIVANILPVLGIPFLLISWIMLVQMAFSLAEVKTKYRALWIHLVFWVVVIALVLGIFTFEDNTQWLLGDKFIVTEIAIFIGLELGYMILFAGIVWQNLEKNKQPNNKIVIRFVLLMLLALVLRIGALPFVFSDPWILAPLILLYFISNFVPLFYLNVNSDLVFVPLYAENPNMEKKEFIYRKYQISKREKEIIEQICLGKSNQQIADTLFIGLQTVKDHTHRIYTKIGINSRMKLVQMVNG